MKKEPSWLNANDPDYDPIEAMEHYHNDRPCFMDEMEADKESNVHPIFEDILNSLFK